MLAFTVRKRRLARDHPPPDGAGAQRAGAAQQTEAARQGILFRRILLGPDRDAAGLGAGPAAVRRLIIFAIIAYFLIGPAASQTWHRPSPVSAFLLGGSLLFIALIGVLVGRFPDGSARVPWILLAVILGLSIALFVVDGSGSWVIVPAMAAACGGRFTATPVPAAGAAVICGAAGLAVAIDHHYDYGSMAIVTLVPALAAFFSYTAGKRAETLATLRQTRAELARMAVAEERLRIARDLHDLLGHSLSLITLKAELSRRLLSADSASAAREMAELEAVARQSLSDVRAAVAGYRKPDLTAELGAARQMLAAAGIACSVTTPETLSLPAEVDTVLAWAVREGVTNVVRHSRATRAAITIDQARDGVAAEITDYNDRAPAETDAAPAWAGCGTGGSGLAGLGERVRQLGGDLTAVPARPAGFRLRITIPASALAMQPEPASSAASTADGPAAASPAPGGAAPASPPQAGTAQAGTAQAGTGEDGTVPGRPVAASSRPDGSVPASSGGTAP